MRQKQDRRVEMTKRLLKKSYRITKDGKHSKNIYSNFMPECRYKSFYFL